MAIETIQNTEYLYPSTWTNLTDTAANYAAGFPTWANQTYQNWYDQPLTTGTTPTQANVWGQMLNPSQQWTQGITSAQTAAQAAQPLYTQGAQALAPWSATIGSGLQTLGQTPSAVNPYMSGTNTYQELGQNQMAGYGTAMGTLGSTQGTVNPYLSGIDVNQQDLLQTLSGYGTAANTLGQTLGAVNPYLSAITGYQQGATGAQQAGSATAQNYLAGTTGAVSPYQAAIDALQSQAQNYTGQIGQGQTTLQQGLGALSQVTPYLQQAAQGYAGASTYNPSELTQFLNPYTQQAAQATVSDLTRNLQEKILPEVNTTFTGAGQFGSSRNKEFEARAIRDTQEAAAKALAQANYGAYSSAQQAYSDWANKELQAAQGTAGLAGQQTSLGQAISGVGTQQAQVAQQQVASTLQNAGLDQNQASLVANMMPQLATVQNQITQQSVSTQLQNAGISQNQANTVAQLYPQLAQMQGTLTQNQIQAYLQNAGLDQNQANLVANMLPQIASQQASVTNQAVSNYLQQAGLDQNQASLIAQLYPQLATSYATIGGQYGNISGAYQNLGTGQTALGATLGNLAQTGSTLTQQQLINALTAATQEQQQLQTGLTTNYEDWLKQQQFPISTLGALGSSVGAMSAGTKPNVAVPVTQPDDVTRILAAVQAASQGMSDTSVQSILDYLFPEGTFSFGA